MPAHEQLRQRIDIVVVRGLGKGGALVQKVLDPGALWAQAGACAGRC